jgi:hypothetical protein
MHVVGYIVLFMKTWLEACAMLAIALMLKHKVLKLVHSIKEGGKGMLLIIRPMCWGGIEGL